MKKLLTCSLIILSFNAQAIGVKLPNYSPPKQGPNSKLTINKSSKADINIIVMRPDNCAAEYMPIKISKQKKTDKQNKKISYTIGSNRAVIALYSYSSAFSNCTASLVFYPKESKQYVINGHLSAESKKCSINITGLNKNNSQFEVQTDTQNNWYQKIKKSKSERSVCRAKLKQERKAKKQ